MTRGRTWVILGVAAVAGLGIVVGFGIASIVEQRRAETWLVAIDDPTAADSRRFTAAEIREHQEVLIPAAIGLLRKREQGSPDRWHRMLVWLARRTGWNSLPRSHFTQAGWQGSITVFSVLGEEAAPAIPALEEVLNDPNSPSRVRGHAAHLLGMIGPPALPALRAVLRDEDRWVAMDSLVGIRQAGRRASFASGEILLLLDRITDDVTRAFVIGVLAKVGDEDRVVAELLKRAPFGSRASDCAVADALAQPGPKATDAGDYLVRRIENGSEVFVIEVRALAAMDRLGEVKGFILERIYSGDADSARQAEAVVALKHFSGEDPDIVTALNYCLASQRPLLRASALDCLEELDSFPVAIRLQLKDLRNQYQGRLRTRLDALLRERKAPAVFENPMTPKETVDQEVSVK